MTYKDALERLIWNFRLDYDPVGILFVKEDTDTSKLKITHKAKSKLTYCQYIAAARQARHALFMEPGRLMCGNAQPVFGFRDLEEEKDGKAHRKYLVDPDLAWKAPQEKVKLPLGECTGIYIAPVDMFDEAGLTPDVVFMMVLPFQAYHILNDYMGATDKAHLNFRHTPNSAVCGGTVYAHVNHTANMNTMCAGSKASGKTEMGYMNLVIPGDEFLPTVGQLEKRIAEHGGPSLLGKGGQPWPGLDACSGCPLVRFEPVSPE